MGYYHYEMTIIEPYDRMIYLNRLTRPRVPCVG